MYKCLICNDILDKEGSCLCGRLTIDKKGKPIGELYTECKLPTAKRQKTKSKKMKCPHCGWEGLVVPAINLGCPLHGLWYKKEEEDT